MHITLAYTDASFLLCFINHNVASLQRNPVFLLLYRRSHPAVSSLSRVWNQDGPLQLGRAQNGPPLAQSEDSVPALQRRFGEET